VPLHRKREPNFIVFVLLNFLFCPFFIVVTSFQVSIRGRILRGVVVSNKMQRSVILRRDYLHYIKKYNRYEKRHKNFAAHVSPCFKVAVGDGVIAGQCR
jgi:small subunit ribosomal protein S11e